MKMHGQTLCTCTNSSLAGSLEDCQRSPGSGFIVGYFLIFYFKKDQTHCSIREILISSISSEREAALVSHRRKCNSSCSALHEALVQLFFS